MAHLTCLIRHTVAAHVLSPSRDPFPAFLVFAGASTSPPHHPSFLVPAPPPSSPPLPLSRSNPTNPGGLPPLRALPWPATHLLTLCAAAATNVLCAHAAAAIAESHARTGDGRAPCSRLWSRPRAIETQRSCNRPVCPAPRSRARALFGPDAPCWPSPILCELRRPRPHPHAARRSQVTSPAVPTPTAGGKAVPPPLARAFRTGVMPRERDGSKNGQCRQTRRETAARNPNDRGTLPVSVGPWSAHRIPPEQGDACAPHRRTGRAPLPSKRRSAAPPTRRATRVGVTAFWEHKSGARRVVLRRGAGWSSDRPAWALGLQARFRRAHDASRHRRLGDGRTSLGATGGACIDEEKKNGGERRWCARASSRARRRSKLQRRRGGALRGRAAGAVRGADSPFRISARWR